MCIYKLKGVCVYIGRQNLVRGRDRENGEEDKREKERVEVFKNRVELS